MDRSPTPPALEDVATQPTVRLNDGREMPQLGLGCYQTPAPQAAEIIGHALASGYRAFDTAAIYANEEPIGEALRASGLPREAYHLTTKLWIDRLAYDAALEGLDWSLKRLGLDHVDLYLIHWPNEGYVEAWKALVRLKEQGLARSVGVSNFTIEHLERVIGETGVTPAVNQIELHPQFPQRALREFHDRHGIATESWAPLGRNSVLDSTLVADLAAKHGKTPGQVLIRWHLQNGLIVIPKSVTPSRITANIDVFDFELDEADMAALATLEKPDGRIGPDPALPHPFPHYRSPENR